MSPSSLQLDSLLAERSWLRRLALELLGDPHAADDVTQEVALAALRQARQGVRHWPSWLRQVTRRLALRRQRAEQLRRQREAMAQPGRDWDPTDEVVAKATMQRDVVQHLLELDEPYRGTLLLRYFEDLRPPQIARRLGVPVDTVYARLRRGLAQLRSRLGRRDEDWRQALLPLAFGPGVSITTPLLGFLTMSAAHKTLLTAGAALLCLALWALLYEFGADPGLGRSTPTDPTALQVAGAESRGSAGQAESSPGTAPGRDKLAPTSQFGIPARVLQPGERPLGGARVRAEMFAGYEFEGEPMHSAEIEADAEGRFRWDLPKPEETVRVRFVSAEPQRWHGYGHALLLRSAGDPEPVDVQAFTLDIQIRGRVRDRDGKPLADVRIANPFVDRHTHSLADGSFALPTTSIVSNATLFCRKPGYCLRVVELNTGTAQGELSAEVVLERGLRGHGRVQDPAGQPVAGARLKTANLDDDPARSDAEGRFELYDLLPGQEELTLWVQHEDFLARRLTVRCADLRAGLDIELQPGRRVTGHVFGPQSRPLAGVELQLGPKGKAPDRCVSRDDGSFEFRRAAHGKLLLRGKRDGLASVQQTLDFGAEQEALRGVVLRMEPEGILAGVVRGRDGKPLARSAGVVAFIGGQHFSRGGRTDQHGRFRLGGLPQGQAKLEVYASGYLRRELQGVPIGREDLSIQLERAASLAGKVVDGTSGAPIENFTVRIVEAERRPGEHSAGSYSMSWAEPGVRFSNGDGVWRSAGHGAGEFRPGGVLGLEFLAKGYGPVIDRRVIARCDPQPEDLVVRLFPAASISGRVIRAADGQAVGGAVLRLFGGQRPLRLANSWYERQAIVTRTAADGSFELRGVPRGKWSLRVESSAHPWLVHGPLEVEGQTTPPQLIQLGAGQVLRGRLRGAAQMHLLGMDTPPGPDFRLALHPDAEGRFATAARLGPGSYRIDALLQRGPGQYVLRQAQVEIGAAEPAAPSFAPGGTAHLVARPRPGTSRGRIRRVGESQWLTVPLHEGGFELEGLAAGTYQVSTLGRVELAAGETKRRVHGEK